MIIHKSYISFGEQIRLIREQNNLTLREVSRELNIDTSLLGKIERNQRQPTKEQIILLGSFYKIDLKELTMANLSDQLAYKVIDSNVGIEVFKVAEEKVQYFKKMKK